MVLHAESGPREGFKDPMKDSPLVWQQRAADADPDLDKEELKHALVANALSSGKPFPYNEGIADDIRSAMGPKDCANLLLDVQVAAFQQQVRMEYHGPLFKVPSDAPRYVQELLKADFPMLYVDIRQSRPTGGHVVPRTLRNAFNHEVAHSKLQLHVPKSGVTLRAIVVGEYPTMAVKYGWRNVAFVAPKTDVTDFARIQNFRSFCVNRLNSGLSIAPYASLEHGELVMNEKFFSTRTIQRAPFRSDNMIFSHVYLAPEDYVEAMENAGARVAYCQIMCCYELINLSEGETFHMKFLNTTVLRKKNDIIFFLAGDNQAAYVHDFYRYRLLRRTTHFTAMSGKQYYFSWGTNHLGMQQFNIIRCDATDLSGSRAITFRGQRTFAKHLDPKNVYAQCPKFRIEEVINQKLVVPIYYDVNSLNTPTKYTGITCYRYCVDRELTGGWRRVSSTMVHKTFRLETPVFQDIVAFMVKVQDGSFTVQHVYKAYAVFKNRVKVNNDSVLEGTPDMDPEFVYLCVAIYFHLYVAKYEASKTASKLKKDAERKRDFSWMRFVYYATIKQWVAPLTKFTIKLAEAVMDGLGDYHERYGKYRENMRADRVSMGLWQLMKTAVVKWCYGDYRFPIQVIDNYDAALEEHKFTLYEEKFVFEEKEVEVVQYQCKELLEEVDIPSHDADCFFRAVAYGLKDVDATDFKDMCIESMVCEPQPEELMLDTCAADVLANRPVDTAFITQVVRKLNFKICIHTEHSTALYGSGEDTVHLKLTDRHYNPLVKPKLALRALTQRIVKGHGQTVDPAEHYPTANDKAGTLVRYLEHYSFDQVYERQVRTVCVGDRLKHKLPRLGHKQITVKTQLKSAELCARFALGREHGTALILGADPGGSVANLCARFYTVFGVPFGATPVVTPPNFIHFIPGYFDLKDTRKVKILISTLEDMNVTFDYVEADCCEFTFAGAGDIDERLYRGEWEVIKAVLIKGGNMSFKFNHCVTGSMYSLLCRIVGAFEEATLIKLTTSRETNSEFHVVGKGFVGEGPVTTATVMRVRIFLNTLAESIMTELGSLRAQRYREIMPKYTDKQVYRFMTALDVDDAPHEDSDPKDPRKRCKYHGQPANKVVDSYILSDSITPRKLFAKCLDHLLLHFSEEDARDIELDIMKDYRILSACCAVRVERNTLITEGVETYTWHQNKLHRVRVEYKERSAQLMEVEGDIFDSDLPIAHAVSADLKMSKGFAAAVQDLHPAGWRSKVKTVVGGCVETNVNGRSFFHLVTKSHYYAKPNMVMRKNVVPPSLKTTKAALVALRMKLQQRRVAHVAMPRICCGLDKMSWDDIRGLLLEVLVSAGLSVTVYAGKDTVPTPRPVIEEPKLLKDTKKYGLADLFDLEDVEKIDIPIVAVKGDEFFEIKYPDAPVYKVVDPMCGNMYVQESPDSIYLIYADDAVAAESMLTAVAPVELARKMTGREGLVCLYKSADVVVAVNSQKVTWLGEVAFRPLHRGDTPVVYGAVGMCFYDSVAASYYELTRKIMNPLEVKLMGLDWLSKKQTEELFYLDHGGKDVRVSKKEYMEAIMRDEVYAQGAIIDAVAIAMEVTIRVHLINPDGQEAMIYINAGRTVTLELMLQAAHYTALVPEYDDKRTDLHMCDPTSRKIPLMGGAEQLEWDDEFVTVELPSGESDAGEGEPFLETHFSYSAGVDSENEPDDDVTVYSEPWTNPVESVKDQIESHDVKPASAPREEERLNDTSEIESLSSYRKAILGDADQSDDDFAATAPSMESSSLMDSDCHSLPPPCDEVPELRRCGTAIKCGICRKVRLTKKKICPKCGAKVCKKCRLGNLCVTCAYAPEEVTPPPVTGRKCFRLDEHLMIHSDVLPTNALVVHVGDYSMTINGDRSVLLVPEIDRTTKSYLAMMTDRVPVIVADSLPDEPGYYLLDAETTTLLATSYSDRIYPGGVRKAAIVVNEEIKSVSKVVEEPSIEPLQTPSLINWEELYLPRMEDRLKYLNTLNQVMLNAHERFLAFGKTNSSKLPSHGNFRRANFKGVKESGHCAAYSQALGSFVFTNKLQKKCACGYAPDFPVLNPSMSGDKFVISDYTEKYFTPLEVLHLGKHLKCPTRPYRAIMFLAGPGVGKTYTCLHEAKKALTEGESVLILTSTRAGKDDITERLKKLLKDVTVKFEPSMVSTVAAMKINGYASSVDNLYVDEALMEYMSDIHFVISMTSPKQVKYFGDTLQIPFINRMPAIGRLPMTVKDMVFDETRTLDLSRRSPCDVVKLLAPLYSAYNPAFKFRTTNQTLKSVKSMQYFNNLSQVLAGTGRKVFLPTASAPHKGVILTWVQADKELLRQSDTHGWEVHTIHEFQGKESEHVIVFRQGVKKIDLFNSEAINNKKNIEGREWNSHALVAISRHTKSFLYVCPVVSSGDEDPLYAYVRLCEKMTADVARSVLDLTGAGVIVEDQLPVYQTPFTVLHYNFRRKFITEAQERKKYAFGKCIKGVSCIPLWMGHLRHLKTFLKQVSVPVALDIDRLQLDDMVIGNEIHRAGKLELVTVYSVVRGQRVIDRRLGEFCLNNAISNDPYVVPGTTKVEDHHPLTTRYDIGMETGEALALLQEILDEYHKYESLKDRSMWEYLRVIHQDLTVANNISFNRMNLVPTDAVYGNQIIMHPTLNTPAPMRGAHTVEAFIAAVGKRNSNVTMFAPPVDPVHTAVVMASAFVTQFLDEKKFKALNVNLRTSATAAELWRRALKVDVAAHLDQDYSIYEQDVTKWTGQLKSTAKPTLARNAYSVRPLEQVIVHNSKDYNTIYCQIAIMLYNSILATKKDHLHIFNGLSVADFCARLSTDKHFAKLSNRKIRNAVKRELDVSKYDKSHWYSTFLYTVIILKLFGLPKEEINLLFKSCSITSFKDMVTSVTVRQVFQMRSGSPFTLLFNTLVLLGLLSLSYKCECKSSAELACIAGKLSDTLRSGVDIVVSLPEINYEELRVRCDCPNPLLSVAAVGDDSIVVVDPAIIPKDCGSELEAFGMNNFEVKNLSIDDIYFCGKMFVNIAGCWHGVADPLKIAVKLGRADLVSEAHVQEFAQSLCDLTENYNIPEIMEAASESLKVRYGIAHGKELMAAVYQLVQVDRMQALFTPDPELPQRTTHSSDDMVRFKRVVNLCYGDYTESIHPGNVILVPVSDEDELMQVPKYGQLPEVSKGRYVWRMVNGIPHLYVGVNGGDQASLYSSLHLAINRYLLDFCVDYKKFFVQLPEFEADKFSEEMKVYLNTKIVFNVYIN
uniref:Uncharacterized protein n=1 Tax=Frankliniella occidentalis associated negev-like virus 1 TaxID=2767262 RepID=A0A7G9IR70_9VIRU|nr:hypothetical protein [Frankliniella occidentalis associated negev-like virus 1]